MLTQSLQHVSLDPKYDKAEHYHMTVSRQTTDMLQILTSPIASRKLINT